MRRAITLIEVLAVVGILVLLVGLFLPAVHKVRVAALTIKSRNNLKQIGLATLAYAGDHDSRVPWAIALGDAGAENNATVFVALLPYIEQDALYRSLTISLSGTQRSATTVPTYLNPLDPSLSLVGRHGIPRDEDHRYLTSYAYNAQLFASRPFPDLTSRVTDGLSQTMMFTQHYAYGCGGYTFFYNSTMAASPPIVIPDGSVGDPNRVRRPSFADGGPGVVGGPHGPLDDYYPITTMPGPASRATKDVTFQHRPSVRECDPRLANSVSPGGLQVAFGDGGVRTIAPSVAPGVFWAAVTPAGGEHFEADW